MKEVGEPLHVLSARRIMWKKRSAPILKIEELSPVKIFLNLWKKGEGRIYES